MTEDDCLLVPNTMKFFLALAAVCALALATAPELTAETFSSTISGDKPAFIKFYAPCKPTACIPRGSLHPFPALLLPVQFHSILDKFSMKRGRSSLLCPPVVLFFDVFVVVLLRPFLSASSSPSYSSLYHCFVVITGSTRRCCPSLAACTLVSTWCGWGVLGHPRGLSRMSTGISFHSLYMHVLCDPLYPVNPLVLPLRCRPSGARIVCVCRVWSLQEACAHMGLVGS